MSSEIRGVVLIRVDRALPLISPAYDRAKQKSRSRLDGGTTGESYGMIPGESRNGHLRGQDSASAVTVSGLSYRKSRVHLSGFRVIGT